MRPENQDARLPDYALEERREMIRGLGYGEEALSRPQIGVVNSWGEINPASVHLDRVAEAVKSGIWAAGGAPREFVISAICTSMAGHDNYHLPHRDLVAGYIETVTMTNLFDAMAFIPVCDDVIPAHLMAAARLNLPSVVVTGGYMRLNQYKGKPVDPLKVAPEHFARFKAGSIDEAEYGRIADRGCPGYGACPVMGTANTMACLTEALGMALPYTATTPGADSRLMRMAFSAGRQIMKLHENRIRPADILTPQAFQNAIRVLMAVGGSTNGVLHLQAVAAELDMEISLETFNRASREVPFICDIAPSGEHLMADLDEAGGLPALMKALAPKLDTHALTVTGFPLEETLNVATADDGNVIRSLENPISSEGGLIFLRGSLAPGGALIKTSGVPKNMRVHKGPARVFPDEEAACEALDKAPLEKNALKDGDVVIIRNAGPRGNPGMMLLQRFLWQLTAQNRQDRIAFITDGRLSGTNKGCAAAHVSPESAAGGPLAVVKDGDIIEIDIPGEKLNLMIPEKELQNRLAAWTPPPSRVRKGYLSIYAKNADTTDKGAALKYDGR